MRAGAEGSRLARPPSPLASIPHRHQNCSVPYSTVCFTTRAPVGVPNPFPPRDNPFASAPLPLDGNGAGPLAPPPTTAAGGIPKLTGADACDPMYCEYARQYSV